MPGTHGWSRWRFLITPKWLAWHVFIAASATGMVWLCLWQLRRAEAGNSLSWAYTFEWPFFAILAVIFWGKTIRDEINPPAAGPAAAADLPAAAAGGTGTGAAASRPAGDPAEPGTPEDEELAAYNAYLARLHAEARGHGKWHGWR